MRLRALGWALGIGLIAATASAQVPIGSEFQANSVPASNIVYPSVASDALGRFTVVWSRKNGAVETMAGRRFNAAGQPDGAEFAINESSAGQQTAASGPRVAYEADGGIVVVWSGASSVMGRRYDAGGAPRGPEFVIGAAGPSFPSPRVSAGSGGGFVVTWNDFVNMFARRFDATGAGAPIVTVTSIGALTQVTMVPDGGFVVAWASTTLPFSVWARQFDASSTPRGPAFSVAQGGGLKHQVGLGSDSNGSFTVVWHDYGTGPANEGTVLRTFDAAGNPVTGEIVVNTYTTGQQVDPEVAVSSTSNGDIVVAWTTISDQEGNGGGVFGRRLDGLGNFRGGEFQVNAYTTGDQMRSSVAIDGGGRVTAVWEDVPRNGIYARRFSSLVPAALEVDRTATAGSNGNRVFEPGETATIEPSWRNTAAVPLTYAGASAALTGPAGPSYTTPDPTASYPAFPAGAAAGCRDLGDCYAAQVTGVRPAVHWDPALNEDFAPAGSAGRAWTIHVGQSFTDVPLTNPFYRFVETLLHNGVTAGCGGASYCPASSVSREQMPVFVLRSYGPALLPAACVPGSERFGDVPASSPYCRWIEELARRQVVSGCGGGNYCPADAVSREQMAVFIGATLGLDPPACGTPIFIDVPASSPYCRWIEELFRRGVINGCGFGNYCPTVPVARDAMSAFLGVSFGLALYGP